MEGEGPGQSGRGNRTGERKEDCNEIIVHRKYKSTSKEIVWNESEHDNEKERETSAKAQCEKYNALNVLDTLVCAFERFISNDSMQHNNFYV